MHSKGVIREGKALCTDIVISTICDIVGRSVSTNDVHFMEPTLVMCRDNKHG